MFRHSQAASGPAILMTTLAPAQPAWDKTTLGELATKWREVRGVTCVRACDVPCVHAPRFNCSPPSPSALRRAVHHLQPRPSAHPPARTHARTHAPQMLFQAGIEVTCYDMASMGMGAAGAGGGGGGGGGASGDAQMVVTLQRGWRAYEARDFLLQQAEVTLVEWDGVTSARAAPVVPERLQSSSAGGGGGGGVGVPPAAGGGRRRKGRRRGRARAAADEL